MKIMRVSYPDYVSGVALWKRGFCWWAWATRKNDPWRDGNGESVRLGIIEHRGENSTGRALVIGRLKIGLAWQRRAA